MKPDWINQNMKKSSSPAGADAMSKIYPGQKGSMHSKIAAPSHKMGGVISCGYMPQHPVMLADGDTEETYLSRNPDQADDVATDIKVDDTPATVETRSEAPAPEKKESFREAFARNRAAGAKTFQWNGKQYTTQMAVAGGTKKPASSSVTDTGDETKRLQARSKPKYETAYDRMNRGNREAAASQPRGQDRIIRDTTFDPNKVDSKTMLPKR